MTPVTALALGAPLLLLPAAYVVWWLDRYRLYPLARFAAVFALATAAGAMVVGYWPEAALLGRSAGPALPAGSPAVEVAAAARLAVAILAVLVFLLARGRVETPVDGVVFGVAAGVGLSLPIGWLAVESGAAPFWPALTGAWLVPVTAGVVVGLAVATARLAPRWHTRLAALAVGCAAAIGCIAGARLGAAATRLAWVEPAALIAAVAAAAALAVSSEVRVVRRELAEEVRLGVLPEWAAELAPRYWRRVRARWWPRRDERRALSRLLLQLAFRKHELRRLGGGRATLGALEVGRLRERARRLLDPARVLREVGEGDE